MKKLITVVTAACAVAFVSCNKEDATMNPYVSESQIMLDSSTTRADETTLATMQSSTTGFAVYAVENGNTSDFYIAGKNYLYSGGAWGWESGYSKEWPTEATSYPMTFYALYSDGMAGVSAKAAIADSDPVKYSIAIPDAANQVDIVAANESTDTRPSGGRLSLTFGHILSRINVDFTTESSLRAHIQSVNVAGVDGSRIFNLAASSWDADDTKDNTPSYQYLVTSNPAYQLVTDVTGVSSTSNNGVVIGSLTDITAANTCYGSLMLMPQTLTAWSAKNLSDARVEVIYRISTLDSAGGDESDDIGYADATDHPDYVVGTDTAKELFIKVAFPLDSEWEMNKVYNYTAQLGGLGTSGGLYMDDTYYDENGNDTNLDIDTAEIGEGVNGNDIHFDPVVTSWGESVSKPLGLQ